MKYFLLITLVFTTVLGVAQNSKYQIQLRNHSIEVEQNMSSIEPAHNTADFDNIHYLLIQFYDFPSESQLNNMKKSGIQVFHYISGYAYLVSIRSFETINFSEFPYIRALINIKPEYKIDRNLLGRTPEYAQRNDGNIVVSVLKFPGTSMSKIRWALPSGSSIIGANQSLNSLQIKLPKDKILQLASQAWCYWVELSPPPMSTLNFESRTMLGSNVLALNSPKGRNLTGKGVNVGIWDGNHADPHHDFAHRLTTIDTNTQYNHDHATHVTGIVAGAGIVDPKNQGFAKKAQIFSWDFFGWIPYEMDTAIKYDSIIITQNSYGWNPNTDSCKNTSGYSTYPYLFDDLVYRNPTLNHVFAAGNYRKAQECAHLGGYFTISGYTTPSKNIIVVGGVDKYNNLYSSSSWGPTTNGRIKPDICAVAVSVNSTHSTNKYIKLGGTSMAAPAISGLIAQFIERYHQLWGQNPDASTVKAILCNTATDLGNTGPDYIYGFGKANGLKAIQALENHQFKFDSLSHGNYFYDTIKIGNNVSKLKVLINWTDPPASPLAPVDSNCLINNLNLSVIAPNGSTQFNPLFPDPKNPSAIAIPGIDSINNIEQVVINSPLPGNYIVKVYAKQIVKGKQSFTISYDVKMPKIEITYPYPGDKLLPNENEIIRWECDSLSGNAKIEYSVDSGNSWTTLSNSYPVSRKYFSWTTPATFSSNCFTRIILGKDTFAHQNPFSILSPPVNILTKPCYGQVHIYWGKIAKANSYNLYQLDTFGDWKLAANITDTFYTIKGLSNTTNYWLSLESLDSNHVTSLKSEGIMAKPDGSTRTASFISNIENDTICQRDNVLFKTFLNNRNSIKYQWQKKYDNSKTWQNILGATDSFLSFKTDTTHFNSSYRLSVVNECLSFEYSNIAKLINKGFVQINQQPKDTLTCIDGTARFFTNSFFYEKPYYQWQTNINNVDWNNIANETNDSILVGSVKYSMDSTTYRLRIVDFCKQDTQYTKAALLRVREPLQLGLFASDDTICNGGVVELTAIPKGGDTNNYNMFWGHNSSSSLTFKDTLTYRKTYEFYLWDNCQIGIEIDSITINVLPPLNIDILNSDTTICHNNQVFVKTKASGGKAENYIYNWDPNVSDSSSAMFVLGNTTKCSVALTDNCSKNIATDSIKINVRAPLSVSIISDKDSFCLGDSITLKAIGHGGLDTAYVFSWNSTDTGMYHKAVPQKTTGYRVTLSDNCTWQSANDIKTLYMHEINAEFSSKSEYLEFTGEAYYKNAKAYLWDFDDGTTSDSAKTTHVFDSGGYYNICLEVTNWSGCKKTHCNYIKIKMNNIDKSTPSFSIYPNPTNGLLIIEHPNVIIDKSLIEIYNVIGERIDFKVMSNSNGKSQINLLHNKNGVYFVELNDSKNKHHFKIIKY